MVALATAPQARFTQKPNIQKPLRVWKKSVAAASVFLTAVASDRLTVRTMAKDVILLGELAARGAMRFVSGFLHC